MRLRRAAAAMLALVGGGVVAVMPAAPAAAEVNPTDIVRVVNTVSEPAGTHPSVTAYCPAGMQVISVGGNVFYTESPGDTYITSMRPTPNYDGGTVSGMLTVAGRITTIIECAPFAELAGVTRVTVRENRITPGFRDLVQRCPAGMYGFGGGGGFVFGASQMSADLATADGTGWEYAGTVINRNDSTQLDLQCAPDTGLTFQTSSGADGQGNQILFDAVSCPAPYRVLSGGAYLANPNGSPAMGQIEASYASASGSFWFVAATAPVGGKVVAVARCVRS